MNTRHRSAYELSAPVGERFEDLVVARESDMYDDILLTGMVVQTLSYCKQLPGVDVVLSAGLEPLRGECPFPHVRIRRKKCRAVLFEHQGVLYLYSGATAAQMNDAGDNDFIEELCDIITEFRPKRVHVATMSRLIRSPVFSGTLLGVCERNVQYVHCGGAEIDLGNMNGKLQWQALGMVAAMERDLIVQRLTAGRVHKYLRSEWVFGSATAPPGYKVVDHRLVIDHEAVPVVREMLTILADTSITPRRTMFELGKLGITSAHIQAHHGPDATTNDVTFPGVKLSRLLAWSELYRTGSIDMRLQSPFPSATAFIGVPVEPYPDRTGGFLRLTYSPGVPPGGWAEPEIVEAVALRASMAPKSRTGGAAKRRRKPMVGLEWETDGWRYWLGGFKAGYRLKREPCSADTDIEGDEFGLDIVGMFSPSELHQGLAFTFAGAIRDGIHLERVDGLKAWDTSTLHRLILDADHVRRRTIADQVKAAKARLTRARNNANDEDDEDLRNQYRSDAREAQEQLRVLEAEQKRLEATTPERGLPDSISSDAEIVVRALAALAACDGLADWQLADSLRHIVDGFRFIEVGDHEATWSASLLLPTTEGVVRLGPVTGTVPNRAYVVPRRNPGRLKYLVERVLGADELRGPDGVPRNASDLRRRVVAKLEDHIARSNARVLSRCPIPEVIDIVCASLYGTPMPPGLDEAYVDWIRELYVTQVDFPWQRGIYICDTNERQAFVDHLIRTGLQPFGDAIRPLLGGAVTRNVLRYHTKARDERGCPPWPPTVERVGTWARNGSPNLVQAYRCPHDGCDGYADLVLRVPDVPRGLLCSTCMRQPVADSPVFPDSYRTLRYDGALAGTSQRFQRARGRTRLYEAMPA